MKKILTGLFLSLYTLNLSAQELATYEGSYRFVYENEVQKADITLQDGQLHISAPLGTARLSPIGKDTFQMDVYQGKAIFSRNRFDKITQMKVLIPTFGIEIKTDKAGTLKDVQGHRGACGLWPCNTIRGFLNATDLGIQTLEMDAVISKDKKVVVSHDQFMDYTIVKPSGEQITKEEMLKYNIYQMPYDSVKLYDAGSGLNPHHPAAEKYAAVKPLLSEVIEEVESHISKTGRNAVSYNIEIKSLREDDVYHPKPEEFSDLVIAVVKAKGIAGKTIIQSFDIRALKYIHTKYPEIKLAFLVSNKLTVDENIKNLGFSPQIYSPQFQMLNPESVKAAQAMNMQVVPWTVNEPEDIRDMISLGVDGIISDYPDRVLEISGK